MSKHSYPKRIFTFNSGTLRGYHAGYSGTALSPAYVGEGRCFDAFDNAVSQIPGYVLADAVDGTVYGAAGNADTLVLAVDGTLIAVRYT